jgi:hypothetical protein
MQGPGHNPGEKENIMKVWNTTTNEDTELRYSNLSDPYIDDAQDIIGNAGGLHYNREAGRYEMDADEIAWWDEYLTNSHDDAEQAAKLIEEYGDEARAIINEALDGIEMSDEHAAYQSAFDEIKSSH